MIRPALLTLFAMGCASSNATGPAAHYDLEGDDVMLEGYDAVAYHTEGEALEGRPEVNHPHEGVTYYFANRANRDTFAENPSAYVPAWGGWCAWAVAHDGTFDADPESFIVEDGRLFLFHDSIFFDAKQAWLDANRHAPMVKAGDRYWQHVTAASRQRPHAAAQ